MGWLDQLKKVFDREAASAKKWVDDVVSDANTELDKAERRIDADPSVRMAATLEDIEESDAGFDAVRDKAEGESVRPAAEAELGPEEGVVFTEEEPPEATDAAADLPNVPGMAMARMWVRVDEDPAHAREGFHALAIEDLVGPVVGEDWFAESFAETVQGLDEVEETIHASREVLHVRGADLSGQRARMLTASVLAPRIGDDWRERLG